MSLVKIRSTTKDGTAVLTETLMEEFRNPSPGNSQPLISIEQPGDRTHLLVIWDVWENLSQRERSEIVIDAYSASAGSDAADRVSVAMGLTAVESRRLGYDFDPA